MTSPLPLSPLPPAPFHLTSFARKSCRIKTCAFQPCNPFRMNTYRNAALKVLWNEHLQKKWGVGGLMVNQCSLRLAPVSSFECQIIDQCLLPLRPHSTMHRFSGIPATVRSVCFQLSAFPVRLRCFGRGDIMRLRACCSPSACPVRIVWGLQRRPA